MMYLLLFLVPIAALLAWAARVDRKRRRRETSVHDIRATELAGRRDAERKTTEWGAGA
jgi:HAMP domain-containing protein